MCRTHPSLNFLRRATALFLIIVLTSRPPELSPSLVDDVRLAASSSVSSSVVDATVGAMGPVAACVSRWLIFDRAMLTFEEAAAEAANPGEIVAAAGWWPSMLSFETLRRSLPRSLLQRRSEWCSESDDDADGEEAFFPSSFDRALGFRTPPKPVLSMLDADFWRLPTEAWVDIFRRDFSSAFRSMGIMDARIGGRLTVVFVFVAAFGSSEMFAGFWSVFAVVWVSLLFEVVEDVEFGPEINCSIIQGTHVEYYN